MERQNGRTVVTIETIQRTTIRLRKTAETIRCERCAAVVKSEAAAHRSANVEFSQLTAGSETDLLKRKPGDNEL